MSKKSILTVAIISIFGLTGCFGGDEEDGGSNQEIAGTKKIYETNDFSIALPLDWEVVEESQFTSNVPSEAKVVFVNNLKSDRFTANVNIHVTQFTEEVSISDFATSSLEQARNTLTSFSEGQSSEISVSFGEESIPGIFLNFSGKRNSVDPLVQWQQLTVISDELGYTISGSYLSDENENVVKQVSEMLNSFALK